MKKLFLVFSLLLLNIFISFKSYSACEIPADSTLRNLVRNYARACGSEGDSPLRYTSACSDFERSPDFSSYQRECTGTSLYSPCGCLRSKDCFSEDPLFTELSCSGSRPAPAPTPPPPASESRPAPHCGDGIVQTELGEECELPYVGNCNEVCKWIQSKCGDGRVDYGRGEECEPPATRHGSWECNEECIIKKVQPDPKCGDGTINQTTEECEPAGTSTCDDKCKRIRFCGDGMVDVDLGEQCERPNTLGCDRDCKKIGRPETPPSAPPSCGDGILQTERGEQCEKAGVGNCSLDCKIVQPSETPLVQQTLELLLQGGGMKCSMILQTLHTHPLSSFSLLFFSFGSAAAFWIMRSKK